MRLLSPTTLQACPDRLAGLRARIARLERTTVRPRPATPLLRFGLPPIDAHLPAGGLGPGLHEMAAAGVVDGFATAPARLAAHLLGRSGRNGPVLWVTEHADLFAPALASVGLPAGRLLLAEAGPHVLGSMEEGARCTGLAGVVGEIGGRFDLTASRRLLLAAEEAGIPVIALRRPRLAPRPGASSPLDAPNAAITRWRIATLPSRPADPIASGPFSLTVGPALWRLDLVRARGVAPASWIVEAFDEAGRLALPALSRHGQAPNAPRRAAGDRAA